MQKFIRYSIALFVMLVSLSCKRPEFDKNKYGNCTDGIQNQNEENTDCGGYCMPCASCDDGVKNSGETGIDCGTNCISCSPACNITPSTCSYTLYPAGFTGSVSNTSSSSGGFYASSQNYIDLSFSGGYISSMKINLYPGFNPLTYIPLNETMIFKTINYTGSTITAINKVTVNYNGSFGFSALYGSLDAGQVIYMTRISNNSLRIRFCDLQEGNQRFSLNTISF